MNNKLTSNRAGAATVVLLSFLLFYFPSVITILSEHHTPPEITRMNIAMSTTYTAIFCLNYFLIIPKSLFGHGRKLWFYIGNAVIIVLGLCVLPVWFESHGGLPRPRHDIGELRTPARLVMDYLRFAIRDGVMMILSIALAYALQLSKEREYLRRRELELDAAHRRIEIRGLKMQLNPHFLFNSLNNIYALISISPERAQEALHDLSGMLRYMIYSASAAGVPLVKEMAFIDDFVRLSCLRMSNTVKIDCKIDRSGADGLIIAPLLFLTLVENAFKHYALDPNGKGYISVEISAGEEEVTCRVENSKRRQAGPRLSKNTEAETTATDGGSGIGLSNVRRQLRLLYPDAHTLDLTDASNRFIATLRISRHVLHNGK